MNKYDLQLLFEDNLGLLMSDVAKTFKTSEIERFLNDAQDQYFATLAKVFEVDERVRRSLSHLTKSESISGSATPPVGVTKLNTNSMFYTILEPIDDDMYKIVEDYVTDLSGNKIDAKPVTHDQYHANIDNPYKQPYDKMVWRIDIDGVVEIIPIGITPVLYIYRYLTKPRKIDFTTTESEPLDLRDIDLRSVVDLAVKMALNSLALSNQESN